MTRRAVDADDRLARRSSILEAARSLFLGGEGELPTAAQVAAAAGLAKGTVYLYFKTKEEIFAQLLLDGWTPIMQAAHATFSARTGSRLRKAEAYIALTVDRLARHPELLYLDALSAGVIERNMTAEALHAYKSQFHERLVEAGSRIDEGLRLASGRGVVILMRMYALTRGLWQTAQHEQTFCRDGSALRTKMTLAPFPKELTEALTEYWRGALSEQRR
jgi:TetR/AcrR family transcriptional regulator